MSAFLGLFGVYLIGLLKQLIRRKLEFFLGHDLVFLIHLCYPSYPLVSLSLSASSRKSSAECASSFCLFILPM